MVDVGGQCDTVEVDDFEGTARAWGLTPDRVHILSEAIAILREAGAGFAFLHGSAARGEARPDSDLDVAAWWSAAPPPAFEVLLPSDIDLMVLNDAPLELAGRVAVDGVLLFDEDPAVRVHWVAQTRKIYFDERPRIERSHREFAESLLRGR